MNVRCPPFNEQAVKVTVAVWPKDHGVAIKHYVSIGSLAMAAAIREKRPVTSVACRL
jgi:hypothetical protein